jgi:hypothetical protein
VGCHQIVIYDDDLRPPYRGSDQETGPVLRTQGQQLQPSRSCYSGISHTQSSPVGTHIQGSLRAWLTALPRAQPCSLHASLAWRNQSVARKVAASRTNVSIL